MTSNQDSEFLNPFKKDFDMKDNGPEREQLFQNPAPAEKISLWLAGSIIFFLIIVFAVSGLIVQRVYFEQPVARTAVERDLLRHKDAISKNPRDAEARIGLAGVYLEIEQPRKAVSELEKAIALKPRSWNAHFQMGIALEALDRQGDAITHLWQAAAIDPTNELAYYQLGKLYHSQKVYGQAIQAFKSTLRINPTLSDAHYYLGVCYERTNKFELARNEYREALRYVERYPEAEKALERLK